jgi:DNA-binding MarR family transcriptional regulator
MPDGKTPSVALDKHRLEGLSEFRWQLRRFLRFSEDAAREAGVTVLQYQLLLHTHGFPGREWATIGELAERLQAQHHGVVALVTRCEEAGLVRRKHSKEDRRNVEVHLLAKGRRLLDALAARHQSELKDLAEVIKSAEGIRKT